MVAARRPGCVQRLLRDSDYRLTGLRREPRTGAAKEALLSGRASSPFSGGGHMSFRARGEGPTNRPERCEGAVGWRGISQRTISLSRAYHLLESVFSDIWPHH